MYKARINTIERFCRNYFGGECKGYYNPMTEFYEFVVRNDDIGYFKTDIHKNTFRDTPLHAILLRIGAEYNGWLNYKWIDKEKDWRGIEKVWTELK